MHNTYFSLEKIKILSFFTILYPIHSLHPFQDTNWWVCSINLLSSDIPPINCTIGRHITLHILIYQGYINLERLPYMPIKATTKNPSQNITIYNSQITFEIVFYRCFVKQIDTGIEDETVSQSCEHCAHFFTKIRNENCWDLNNLPLT